MQAIPFRPLAIIVPIVLAAGLFVGLLAVPPGAQLWVMLAVGAAALVLLAVHLADLLWLSLLWLAITTVFSGFFWTLDVPGFFNLTVDRIAVAALMVVFALGVATGRVRWFWPGWIGAALAGLLAWMAFSATKAGWTIPPEYIDIPGFSHPYYRFIAAFVFPAALFFIGATAIRSDRRGRCVLWFFSLFGLYLAIVGLAGLFGPRWLAWPSFITDSTIGIHQTRVRGPFLNAADMGMTLVFAFFANLLLMPRVNPAARPMLMAMLLPLPVAIFFTFTRSVWVAMFVCLVVVAWLAPRSRSYGRAVGCLALAALLCLAFVYRDNLLSAQRERGGVAEVEPLTSRVELARVSLDLAADRPITGWGFGHFQMAAPETARWRQVGGPTAFYGKYLIEHNNFLLILAECGIPGLALYSAVVFGLLATSISVYRRLGAGRERGWFDRGFIVFFWVVWVNYFVDAMFRATSHASYPNAVFLLLGGVVVGLHYRLKTNRLPTRPAQPLLSSNGTA